MPAAEPPPQEPSSEAARRLLPQNAYDYFAGAAGDERTYHQNLAAFASVLFRPRCLIPVSKVDTSITLPSIGRLTSPILIAPMAMQKMAHPHGELAVARAVAHHGLAIILSTFSTVSLEDIAAAAPTRLLQLYLYKDRKTSLRLIARARANGYKAIVLTVDAPRYGRRERDRHNAFHMPPHLTLANLPAAAPITESASNKSALDSLSPSIDADLSPDTLRWLVNAAGLPVWVKGVLRADDATRAVEAGAAGIIVSNHGARQLEGTIPSLHALPEVVAAVKRRVPVLLDSGVRTGEDVVRACALGADAVLVGRPVLWALAQGGEKGVRDFLGDMKNAVELSMTLCGATSTKKISRDMVLVQRASRL